MKITKIDHVAIAVSDLDASIHFYENVLGLKFQGTEELPERHVKVAFFECGDTEIELIQGTSSESMVGKFIQRNGDGLYHLALRVDDIEKALPTLHEKGVGLRDKEPKPGANHSRIAFLDVKSTGGVIMELVEKR